MREEYVLPPSPYSGASGRLLPSPCHSLWHRKARRRPQRFEFFATFPVGRWKTIDDVTGKVKSIVVIREDNGKLYGTIAELFDPPVPHPTCYLCSGAMKDQPLAGLQVLWGFKRYGGEWSGGQVLDPESGRIYRASLALEDGGRKLRLHGYFLIPLFGRTEYWMRAD